MSNFEYCERSELCRFEFTRQNSVIRKIGAIFSGKIHVLSRFQVKVLYLHTIPKLHILSKVFSYSTIFKISRFSNFFNASSSCMRFYIFKILVVVLVSQILDFQKRFSKFLEYFFFFKILRFSKFLDSQKFLDFLNS